MSKGRIEAARRQLGDTTALILKGADSTTVDTLADMENFDV